MGEKVEINLWEYMYLLNEGLDVELINEYYELVGKIN